jgi:hypothetical protein
VPFEVCNVFQEAPMARSRTLVQDAVSPPVRRLLVDERCDCCCAQAVVHVVVQSGLDLVFCGHHAREHELQLQRSGALICVDRAAAPLYW